VKSFYKYWGKAKTADAGVLSWHLLPYHCLDVAAVGVEYLNQNTKLCDFFCDRLACNQQQFLNWAGLLLSLHDLGKFSEAFQAQKPDLFLLLQQRAPLPEKQYQERHDSLGQWLWRDWFSEQVSVKKWLGLSSQTTMTGMDYWLRSVTGHHGQPPKVENIAGASDDFFTKADKKSVLSFFESIYGIFLSEGDESILTKHFPEEFEHISQELSWWFAGVVVLADWIGSNTDYFPYQKNEIELAEYWGVAREQARKALLQSGVLPITIKKNLKFNDLFPKIVTPTPLQEWSNKVKISNGPQIYLLEDMTGAGKTEAALMLAYRLMVAGNASGFYVALPTMATANAMYERIANIYGLLFAGNSNLALVHGSRELVDKFASTIIPKSKSERDDTQDDETATARCAAWLADHNKRALLAQAGVGTIDQILLGVLHSKHQSLRLLGLFQKVLIVDEVHACDSYMQGVLEVLLEFHARAGGSAILVSATLPNKMKQTLLKSYARGCNQICPTITQTAYPLATSWKCYEPTIVCEQPIAIRTEVSRQVRVEYLCERSDLEAKIENVLASGMCVCWIRNTVSDAMDAYGVLSKKISRDNISLFHARFTLHDRLQKEDVIKELFGPASTAVKRAGKLVIATQVIEQSLDVDFDLVVSDLAPIDRIIQRAGRLRRHVRDKQGNRILDCGAKDQRGSAVLFVYGPAWDENPKPTWFKQQLPKAAAVYSDHAQLWLTAKALQKGQYSMPDSARDLIENVFDENMQIPDGLQKCNLTAQGANMASASVAKNNTLTFATGYRRGDVMDWWSEAKTPSRLGEASNNVILARWKNNQIVNMLGPIVPCVLPRG